MNNLALVINLHSRSARKDPEFIDELQRLFGDRGPIVLSKHPSSLVESIQDLRRIQPKILFICGGDGTLRATLTEVFRNFSHQTLPAIAILRGGTMNTVADGFGVTRNPLHQLKTVLQKLDQQLPLRSIQRNVLKINDTYGFIFAIGGFSRFIEHYESNGATKWRGFSLVTKTVLSMAVQGPLASSFFHPFACKLIKDDLPWLELNDATSISASAIRHIGFQFKPYYGAESAPGTFGTLLFRRLPRTLMFALPKLFFGLQVHHDNLIQAPTQKLNIQLPSPLRPMVDGDILKEASGFEISASPLLEFILA